MSAKHLKEYRLVLKCKKCPQRYDVREVGVPPPPRCSHIIDPSEARQLYLQYIKAYQRIAALENAMQDAAGLEQMKDFPFEVMLWKEGDD